MCAARPDYAPPLQTNDPLDNSQVLHRELGGLADPPDTHLLLIFQHSMDSMDAMDWCFAFSQAATPARRRTWPSF